MQALFELKFQQLEKELKEKELRMNELKRQYEIEN